MVYVNYINFLFVGENTQVAVKTAATTSYWSPSSRDVIPATVPTDVYSRKVFVGGLPPDIDDGKILALFIVLHAFCDVFASIADEIKNYFERFGPLTVDWPHKAQTKAYFPPKGKVLTCVNFLWFMDMFALLRVCIPVVFQ